MNRVQKVNMKLIALLVIAPCFIWAAAPDGAKDVPATNEAKEEENKPNITKTNVTGNFNPDRTEAWGDVELVGGGQVCFITRSYLYLTT